MAVAKSLVRPRLEYRRLHFREDIDLIEVVQRSTKTLISTVTDKSCEERLRILKLSTLKN